MLHCKKNFENIFRFFQLFRELQKNTLFVFLPRYQLTQKTFSLYVVVKWFLLIAEFNYTFFNQKRNIFDYAPFYSFNVSLNLSKFYTILAKASSPCQGTRKRYFTSKYTHKVLSRMKIIQLLIHGLSFFHVNQQWVILVP